MNAFRQDTRNQMRLDHRIMVNKGGNMPNFEEKLAAALRQIAPPEED
jgi:hypothetical protein